MKNKLPRIGSIWSSMIMILLEIIVVVFIVVGKPITNELIYFIILFGWINISAKIEEEGIRND